MDESEFFDESAPQWEIRSLKHAYQDREPTRYIVDKFFASHTLNIVYGAPGVMKSLLMADLCTCLVSDEHDWLPGVNGDGKGIEVEPGPVFWLDMDNGTRRTDERFSALARARELPEHAHLYYISMPNPAFDGSTVESIMMLQEAIVATRAQMVVVDNLGLSTGTVEENSAQMAHVMGHYRAVAERTGAAVILIHHQRKGGAGGNRAGDALRGHSSIEASLDLAIQIIREPNSSEITIRSTKTRGVDVPTITAVFNFEHVADTNDLSVAWFEGRKSIRGDNPVRDAILDVLEDSESITKMRLVDEVHDRLHGEYGVNRIRNWIGEMIDVTKEIEQKQGTGRSQVLSLDNGKIKF